MLFRIIRHSLFPAILVITLSALSCNPYGRWEGYVTYEVKGTASSVTIDCEEFRGVTVTSLPWKHTIHASATDDTPYTCYISAANNTADDAYLTVSIYIDGKRKKSHTTSGPECSVDAEYDIWGDLE